MDIFGNFPEILEKTLKVLVNLCPTSINTGVVHEKSAKVLKPLIIVQMVKPGSFSRTWKYTGNFPELPTNITNYINNINYYLFLNSW